MTKYLLAALIGAIFSATITTSYFNSVGHKLAQSFMYSEGLSSASTMKIYTQILKSEELDAKTIVYISMGLEQSVVQLELSIAALRALADDSLIEKHEGASYQGFGVTKDEIEESKLIIAKYKNKESM